MKCHLNYIRLFSCKGSKGAKVRNRYNQVPHLIQGTNGKVTNSQLDTTNESKETSPFPAGDHKTHINIRAQRHSKHKIEKTLNIHKRSTASELSVKYLTGGLILVSWRQPHPLFRCGSKHTDIWFACKPPDFSMQCLQNI